ncbi:MAG: radical SAM protein [Proteobacteria bacterium]|nr:radical SAM protein [Pseudomonadota bacterium]MBU1610754.1 radical SAM protein [Pseudomonadota bacterium]
MSIRIPPLMSGGLITNYHCTSKCRHCLYRSSAKREKGYVDYQTARDCFRTARRMGCQNMHIGGGESFLDFEGLKEVLRAAQREGITIEYVETNSIWFSSLDRAVEMLGELKGLGLEQLLVSISPLHNEYIPLRKVRGVMAACNRSGLQIFPWVKGFLPDMETLDENVTHSIEEYQLLFGSDYLEDFPDRYWVHWGGRALETFRQFAILRPAKVFIDMTDPCRCLLDTTHFHFDLNGNYIPGLCSGLAIRREDVEHVLPASNYPVINALVEEGMGGLAAIAGLADIKPSREGYMNKCDLCDDLRGQLSRAGWAGSGELAPAGHYA